MYYITLTGSMFVCLFSSCHACKADLNSNQLIGDWVRILGEVVRVTGNKKKKEREIHCVDCGCLC